MSQLDNIRSYLLKVGRGSKTNDRVTVKAVLFVAVLMASSFVFLALSDGGSEVCGNEKGLSDDSYRDDEGTMDNIRWGIADRTLYVDVIDPQGDCAIGDYSTYERPDWCESSMWGRVNTVEIGYGITHIGKMAFVDETDIRTVSLSSTVESIGVAAFKDCQFLEDMNYPASLKVIGDQAFSNTGLLVFDPSDPSIVSIGCSAFESCRFLKVVTIPESVETIGKHAFDRCTFLHTMIFMSSPDSIDVDGAFDLSDYRDSMTCQVLSPGNSANGFLDQFENEYLSFVYRDIVISEYDVCWCIMGDTLTLSVDESSSGVIRDYWESYRPSWESDPRWLDVKHVVIGAGITNVGNCLFADCYNIQDIDFGPTVETIGTFVTFFSGVKSVTVSSSLWRIAEEAFCETPLEEFFYDGDYWNIHWVGEDAFRSSDKITVILNQGVDAGGFDGMVSGTEFIYKYRSGTLDAVDWTVKDGTLTLSGNNEDAWYSSTGDYEPGDRPEWENAYGWETVSKVVVRSGVGEIGNYSFWYSKIEEIDLSEAYDLTTIGDYAFGFTENLRSIDFSSCIGLEYIGDGSFQQSGVRSVTFCQDTYLETIGDKAFYHCGLHEINLDAASNLETIGGNAFQSDSGLTSIFLPQSLKSIGSEAFSKCLNIETIYYPSATLDIESIGEDAFAFNGDADTEGVADRHTRVYSLGLTGFLDEYKCGNVYFDYAQFTVTYTWVNYDGEVLQVDESVLYGDLPVYSAPTPTHSDGNTFCGWESNTDSEYNVKMVAQFTDGDLSDVGGNAEDGGTEVEDAMVKAVAIAVTAFILLKSFLKHW